MSGRHAFWADDVADEIEAREPSDPIVIKGGVSPSGVPHIGHLNEIMRGYFVAEVLRERGHTVRQVFTSDDMDRLRAVPRKLAALDWTVVGPDGFDAEVLGRHLGQPLSTIPDPFGCCSSFGAHQTVLLEKSAMTMGVDIEMVRNSELYEDGKFEDVTRRVLEHREQARELLAEYQAGVDESYVAFLPRCQQCGKLVENVVSVSVDDGTVSYGCTDQEVSGITLTGCGDRGTVTLRDGKLPWRFEWPGQWEILGVDFEPFGKDHAEGSWPSGQAIATDVLGIEPPVPMVYEWFTLNGNPLSSSTGNIITVDEVLSMIEVQVFRYFFIKNPRKSRDFVVARLDQLVDEFDRFERVYFGEVADESIRSLAERAYPFVVDEIRSDRIRLPYTFAAVLGMTDDEALRRAMAEREGHIAVDSPEWAVTEAMKRVEKARTWAEVTDNEYNYRLAGECPDVEFDQPVRKALDDLADFIQEGHDADEIQGKIYETARDHEIEVSDFFAAGYQLFFEQESGPRLGPFLEALDREFVVTRLRCTG